MYHRAHPQGHHSVAFTEFTRLQDHPQHRLQNVPSSRTEIGPSPTPPAPPPDGLGAGCRLSWGERGGLGRGRRPLSGARSSRRRARAGGAAVQGPRSLRPDALSLLRARWALPHLGSTWRRNGASAMFEGQRVLPRGLGAAPTHGNSPHCHPHPRKPPPGPAALRGPEPSLQASARRLPASPRLSRPRGLGLTDPQMKAP